MTGFCASTKYERYANNLDDELYSTPLMFTCEFKYSIYISKTLGPIHKSFVHALAGASLEVAKTTLQL